MIDVADFLQSLDVELAAVVRASCRIGDALGRPVAAVGGAVRDHLLQRPVVDVDLMTEAPADDLVEELAGEFKAEFVSHPRFLTFVFRLPSGRKIDIVTAREETYPRPAILPVVTAANLDRDLRRRDFTVNAIACVLNGAAPGTVLDPFEGQADIDQKIIRTLHDRSFQDDPTRIYRAARFAGRLSYSVDPVTEKGIRAAVAAKVPALLSPVRRRHEFELLLKEENPTPALRLLKEWNALGTLYPGWENVDLDGIRFPDRGVGEAMIVDRLATWFKSAPGSAETALADLGFEKTAKRAILASLERP